jgi:hypothetical protein
MIALFYRVKRFVQGCEETKLVFYLLALHVATQTPATLGRSSGSSIFGEAVTLWLAADMQGTVSHVCDSLDHANAPVMFLEMLLPMFPSLARHTGLHRDSRVRGGLK